MSQDVLYRWLDMYSVWYSGLKRRSNSDEPVPSIHSAAKQNRSHAVRSRYFIRFVVLISASAPTIRSGLLSLLEEVSESFSRLNCVRSIIRYIV